MEKVNIAQKFAHITEYWKPCIAAELNGQLVKLVKPKGEFVWHHHENEDEMFLVVKGRFRIEFRDRQVWLTEGEFIVVPRGVESSTGLSPTRRFGSCFSSRRPRSIPATWSTSARDMNWSGSERRWRGPCVAYLAPITRACRNEAARRQETSYKRCETAA